METKLESRNYTKSLLGIETTEFTSTTQTYFCRNYTKSLLGIETISINLMRMKVLFAAITLNPY